MKHLCVCISLVVVCLTVFGQEPVVGSGSVAGSGLLLRSNPLFITPVLAATGDIYVPVPGNGSAVIAKDGKITYANGAQPEQVIHALVDVILRNAEYESNRYQVGQAQINECLEGWKRSNDAIIAALAPATAHTPSLVPKPIKPSK